MVTNAPNVKEGMRTALAVSRNILNTTVLCCDLSPEQMGVTDDPDFRSADGRRADAGEQHCSGCRDSERLKELWHDLLSF